MAPGKERTGIIKLILYEIFPLVFEFCSDPGLVYHALETKPSLRQSRSIILSKLRLICLDVQQHRFVNIGEPDCSQMLRSVDLRLHAATLALEKYRDARRRGP